MRFDQRTIVVLLVSTAYASWPTTGGGGTCGVEASAPFNPGTYYGNAYAQGNERNVNRNGNNAWPAQTSPQESAYDSYGQSSTAEPVSDLPPLPEGWSEHLDPASGQLYYYNANDGTTTWDRPLRLEDEAKAEEVQPPETNTRQNLSGADESRDNDNRATRMAESDVKETHADKMLDAESPQESDHEHKQHSSEDAWRNSASWDSPGEHDPESSPKEAPAEPERGAIPELDQHGWENQNMATADNSATEDFQQEGPGRDTGHFPAQRQPVVDNEQRLEGFSESQLNVDRPDQGPPTSHTGSWGAPRSVEQPRREQDVHERPYEPRSDHVSADTFGRHVPDANRPQPEKQLLPVQHQDQYGVNPRSSVFGLVPEPHNPQQYQRTSPQQSIHRDPEQSVPIQEREQYQERPGTAMPPRQQIMQQHPYGQQRPTHPQQLQQQGPPSQSRVLPPQYQQQQPHPQQQQQQSHHGQYGGPYGQPYGGPYGQYGQPSHGVNTPRGYGTQQQSQQPQRQLISEDTTRPVKEALGRTWQNILGLSNRTKEAVDHARESVVTGAKGASQSLSTTSASWWGQAKNTFGSVFENENGQPSQYSLSGQYGGQREQVIRGPPPGYPPQQGGHPAHGQPQYPPPMHHQGGGYPTYPGQQYPPGYGPPQPRSDPSYPHDPQYRPPAQSQQPPLQAQWGQQQHYPPQYQQGGPGGPRGGPGSPQQRQPQQNEQRPPPRPQGGPSPDTDDPWQHPGLGTDGY